MALTNQLAAIATAIIESHGAYLIEVVARGQQGARVFEVYIDADAGVTAELCAVVSREISQALDAEDLLKQRYHLVVSSPGLDRPLKFLRQYHKNVGRRLRVKFKASDQEELIEGDLVDISQENLVIAGKDGSSRAIPFGTVIESKVLPAFR